MISVDEMIKADGKWIMIELTNGMRRKVFCEAFIEQEDEEDVNMILLKGNGAALQKEIKSITILD